MEGANRAINVNNLQSYWMKSAIKFKDSKLWFKRAVGPDLIHWENLSVTKITRALWTLLIYSVSVVCLVAVIIGIILI